MEYCSRAAQKYWSLQRVEIPGLGPVCVSLPQAYQENPLDIRLDTFPVLVFLFPIDRVRYQKPPKDPKPMGPYTCEQGIHRS